jgi:hypothetical protein
VQADQVQTGLAVDDAALVGRLLVADAGEIDPREVV